MLGAPRDARIVAPTVGSAAQRVAWEPRDHAARGYSMDGTDAPSHRRACRLARRAAARAATQAHRRDRRGVLPWCLLRQSGERLRLLPRADGQWIIQTGFLSCPLHLPRLASTARCALPRVARWRPVPHRGRRAPRRGPTCPTRHATPGGQAPPNSRRPSRSSRIC